MMAADRKKPEKGRPDIWASGGQRPPFDLRALGRASLYLSREGVAPIHAWAARGLRRAAVNVKNGAGRIPAEKLGRAERFVPSHLRVAGWVKNLAATLSHASATADPDVKRGNALVVEIQPHLWGEAEPAPPVATPETAAVQGEVASVVLAEPSEVLQPGDDPLASIRDEMASGHETPGVLRAKAPDLPPPPPGPAAEGAIQVIGYLIGWASLIAALPYGLGRSLWLWISGKDLRQIGADD
jgi:hypothetical protein